MFCQFARLISDENIHVCKHESKSYMKAKHTSIQESYVFKDPMYIFSETGSRTYYLLAWIENQSRRLGIIDALLNTIFYQSEQREEWTYRNKYMKTKIYGSVQPPRTKK